jgi:cytochrome bd-type quinol oxidase subunit 2
MDNVLASLFTIEFVVYCVIIFLAVSGLRHSLEWLANQFFKLTDDRIDTAIKDFWREILLPVLPMIVGGLFAFFVADYPYPQIFTTSVTARVFFGIFTGLVSAHAYPRIKFYLKKLAPSKIDETAEKISE